MPSKDLSQPKEDARGSLSNLEGSDGAHLDVLEGDAATTLSFPLFEADSGMHRSAFAGEPLEEGGFVRG